jgi:hypothetical protein
VLLTDGVIMATAALFADGAGISHRDLDQVFKSCQVAEFDPGEEAGSKRTRVSEVLTAIAESAIGRAVLQAILDKMRASGRLATADISALRNEISLAGWVLNDAVQLSNPLGLQSSATVRKQIEEIRQRVGANLDDLPLLVGSAKEVVESAARTVIEELGGTWSTGSSLDQVFGSALRVVGLDPAVVNDPEIRQVVQSAKTMSSALNALRNAYGTGHGRVGESGIPDHLARFAIRAGLNLADLLLEAADKARKASEKPTNFR